MAPHSFQPVGKTILGDHIGNSAGGVLCCRGIDLLTARHGVGDGLHLAAADAIAPGDVDP